MDVDDKKKEEGGVVPEDTAPKQYTAATSTEELLTFTSAEVQTVPYEIPESESESNDEPIENLSVSLEILSLESYVIVCYLCAKISVRMSCMGKKLD